MQPFVSIPTLLAVAITIAPASSTASHSDTCRTTADLAYAACRKQAFADYWLRRGTCANLTDEGERLECIHEAFDELVDKKSGCAEQRTARRAACDRLGGGPYDPEIDAEDFVARVDNPYFPLVPGTTLVYEKTGGELRGRVERTEVTVLEATERILGVECTAVHDVVTFGGELVEDTIDWFAQDGDGNVWYFGELSLSYEAGRLHDLHGSWRAGVDGAKPGIVMRASPRAGDFYRQEFLLGVAEDLAGVLDLSVQVVVPADSFSDCLLTEELNSLDPGSLEHKSYAPGVGLVLTIEDDGARVELVEIRT